MWKYLKFWFVLHHLDDSMKLKCSWFVYVTLYVITTMSLFYYYLVYTVFSNPTFFVLVLDECWGHYFWDDWNNEFDYQYYFIIKKKNTKTVCKVKYFKNFEFYYFFTSDDEFQLVKTVSIFWSVATHRIRLQFTISLQLITNIELARTPNLHFNHSW